MIKQISILFNIKYTFYALLLSLVLIKNNSFAQYYQYPIIDSIIVIPENPVASIDIVKIISYTNHIRSNCQLVSKLWSWAANDNRFIFNLNYTTNTNSINCVSVDTASLVSPPAGTYDLIVAIKVYSSLDTIVDTLVTSFVMIEGGLNLNPEIDFERLKIYPNPAESSITVTNIQDFGQKGTIQIFDAMGREMRLINFDSANQLNIDINSMSKGIYFLRLDDGSKHITKKFIKE